MCKNSKCQSICSKPGVCDIRKGMLSQGAKVKVTTIDAELDKEVEGFLNNLGNPPSIQEIKDLAFEAVKKAEREESMFKTEQEHPTPPYYDNSKGSLYKVATERGWNFYLSDIVKRLERGGKKDPLKQEIEKSIAVLQLWLKELQS